MCLWNAKRVIDNKPKIGYKVVVKKHSRYVSMYYGEEYKIGEEAYSEIKFDSTGGINTVHAAIHLFSLYQDALSITRMRPNTAILECQILDDSKIYYGVDSVDRPNYAVSGIKVLREL